MSLLRVRSSNLDRKFRITIPKGIGFTPGTTLFATLLKTYLVLSSKAQEGLGVISNEIDSSNRFLLGKPTIEALGLNPEDEDSKNFLWIPHRIGSDVEYLVFFGREGMKTWEQMRQTRDQFEEVFES